MTYRDTHGGKSSGITYDFVRGGTLNVPILIETYWGEDSYNRVRKNSEIFPLKLRY